MFVYVDKRSRKYIFQPPPLWAIHYLGPKKLGKIKFTVHDALAKWPIIKFYPVWQSKQQVLKAFVCLFVCMYQRWHNTIYSRPRRTPANKRKLCQSPSAESLLSWYIYCAYPSEERIGGRMGILLNWWARLPRSRRKVLWDCHAARRCRSLAQGNSSLFLITCYWS